MLHKIKLHIFSPICSMKGKSSKNTFLKGQNNELNFQLHIHVYIFSYRKLPKTSKGALSVQGNGRWRVSKPLGIEFLKFLISLLLLYKCNFFLMLFYSFFLRSPLFSNLIKANGRLTVL